MTSSKNERCDICKKEKCRYTPGVGCSNQQKHIDFQCHGHQPKEEHKAKGYHSKSEMRRIEIQKAEPKKVYVARCGCGEDVFGDETKSDVECSNCGGVVESHYFKKVEVANVTKEVLPVPTPPTNDQMAREAVCGKCGREKCSEQDVVHPCASSLCHGACETDTHWSITRK